VHAERGDTDESLRWIADNTNRGGLTGALKDVMPGADVFVGVSAPDLIGADDVAAMADGAIVFALANPDPEIDPVVARRHATVVATGRSDHPNQINNVLAFPGIFRGLLDAHSHGIDSAVLLAAADAIAATVADDELNANYIVPSVFHPDVHTRVASAVHSAAAGH
jgi:malate dehydrogenase (oxaloacetate-decarboxylating)